MRNVCAWLDYPFPPCRDQPHLHLNSYIGDMLTLGTYKTNVSRETKPSKYKHLTKYAQYIQQALNISYDDHVIIHEWNAHWMGFLIHLYMLISRLLPTCYLELGPAVHTLLCTAIRGWRGERPQHSTGPLAKNIQHDASTIDHKRGRNVWHT